MAKKKARKWSNLHGHIEEAVVEVTEHELAIRAKADEWRGESMNDLAAGYQALVEEEEFEELAAKKRSIAYEALERLIGDELKKVEELSGQDMWRGEGQTFSPKTTPIPVVYDKAALMKHIADTGQQSLLSLSGPTLRALVNDALEAIVLMTPAERAALVNVALDKPVPGVKLYLLKGVHRTKA